MRGTQETTRYRPIDDQAARHVRRRDGASSGWEARDAVCKCHVSEYSGGACELGLENEQGVHSGNRIAASLLSDSCTRSRRGGHVGGDTGIGGGGSCVPSIWVRLREISASGSQRQKGRQVTGLENTDFYK